MAKTGTGSGHGLAIIPEVTYGLTPATPVFQKLRHKSTTLGLSKTGLESEELSADRQIKNYRHGNKSVAGDLAIELSYGTFDELLEALLCGSWATDTPALGTDQLQVGLTRRSFSIERHFADLDVPAYHRFKGCEANSLSLSITPDAIVTGSISMIAQDVDAPATAIIAGATYTPETTTEPYDSFSGTLNEGGSPIATVTSIELTLENGLNPLFVIGSDVTERPSIGKSRISGTIGVLFQDSVMLSKFIDETETSLDFTLTDPAGNVYDFTLPSIKYSGGQPDVSGEGEIILSMPFMALYDETEGSNLTIERTPI